MTRTLGACGPYIRIQLVSWQEREPIESPIYGSDGALVKDSVGQAPAAAHIWQISGSQGQTMALSFTQSRHQSTVQMAHSSKTLSVRPPLPSQYSLFLKLAVVAFWL